MSYLVLLMMTIIKIYKTLFYRLIKNIKNAKFEFRVFVFLLKLNNQFGISIKNDVPLPFLVSNLIFPLK